MNITKDHINYDGTAEIELSPGITLKIETKHDEDMGPPWEEHDGHGEVSEWTERDKRAGEWILCTDRRSRRYYDAAGAMKKAKVEGWGLDDEAKAKLAARLGRTPTAGEVRAAAVEADFKHLKGWATNEWHWLGIIVKIEDADGKELFHTSCWGFESEGDYWKEEAAGMANGLIEEMEKENTERAHWEARDTVTV